MPIVCVADGSEVEQEEVLFLMSSSVEVVSMEPKVGYLVLNIDRDGKDSFIAIGINRKSVEDLRRTLDEFLKATARQVN